MSALPEPLLFRVPKAPPRLKLREPDPDQRKAAVLPLRAVTDKNLTDVQLRVLALICSYTNRAGITWVSTKKLASDLQVSRQAISKQLVGIKAAGYIEVIKRGFRGYRSDTIRVIFDASIDTDTAIAVAGTIEDCRPPFMQEKQQKDMDESIDPEGLARVHQMIKGVFKTVTEPAKDYQMPKSGDTITVAKMKREIAAAKARNRPHIDNRAVDNVEPHIDNHIDNQAVVTNEIRTLLKKVFNLKVTNNSLVLVLQQSIPLAELTTLCKQLADRYQAEGIAIPASEEVLVDALLTLSADNLLRANGV